MATNQQSNVASRSHYGSVVAAIMLFDRALHRVQSHQDRAGKLAQCSRLRPLFMRKTFRRGGQARPWPMGTERECALVSAHSFSGRRDGAPTRPARLATRNAQEASPASQPVVTSQLSTSAAVPIAFNAHERRTTRPIFQRSARPPRGPRRIIFAKRERRPPTLPAAPPPPLPPRLEMLQKC